MPPEITVSRFVFYPCIIIFGLACWYMGFTGAQPSPPISVQMIEMPACMPDPAAPARSF